LKELVFKELDISDKELFDNYFHKFPPTISEYSFTNLYVWKNSRKISYSIFNDELIILAETKKEKYFMQPFGCKDIKQTIEELIEYGIKQNITEQVKRIDEETYSKLDKTKLNIHEDRDSFDYVYLTDDLALLKGRKYSNKRAFVKKFCGEYYHKYWDYSDKCMSPCLELTEKWIDALETKDESVYNEYDAIKTFLENYEHFMIPGGVICCDDKAAAYSFGEKLNKKTFVVHFEKANPEYIGIYQTINRLFVENEIEGKYDFINREQDLGIPGLRKAKLSYYPEKLIKKFNIKAK